MRGVEPISQKCEEKEGQVNGVRMCFSSVLENKEVKSEREERREGRVTREGVRKK